MTLPPEYSEPLARVGSRLGPFGSRILWYPEIGSTNDLAASLAERGAAHGLVIVADAQTAGRGRQGRVWASPAGAGIYATVVLRPDRAIAPVITLAAGVAVAEGIEAATGLAPCVKWPNDIVIEDGGPASPRKLAGILAEGGAPAQGLPWVALGFGINVLPAAYPPEVAGRATSLEAELGRPLERGLVLAECLAALASRYEDLRRGRRDAVIAAWRARAAATFGRRVECEADGRAQRGTAQDIDDTGALLVSTESGLVRVISGEVRWI